METPFLIACRKLAVENRKKHDKQHHKNIMYGAGKIDTVILNRVRGGGRKGMKKRKKYVVGSK